MMKLRINPIVAEDLKKMKEYIAEDNEEMAVNTIQEIYARIENIQQFPYTGADLAECPGKTQCQGHQGHRYVICLLCAGGGGGGFPRAADEDQGPL